MKKEIKNSLPLYKMAYAAFFTAILSIIRGVSSTYEIGIASEAPMAMLAIAFCADTYVQEITSKRSEILRLYPMKKRASSIASRMFIQQLFLFFIAAVGYGLFYILQKPTSPYVMNPENGSEMEQFLIYLASIFITLCFWGMLSNALSCLLRNMWSGIGCCLILWILTDSASGDRYLGPWNLFSYTFRNVDDGSDFRWVYGKIICIGLSIIMALIVPKILKKRG